MPLPCMIFRSIGQGSTSGSEREIDISLSFYSVKISNRESLSVRAKRRRSPFCSCLGIGKTTKVIVGKFTVDHWLPEELRIKKKT